MSHLIGLLGLVFSRLSIFSVNTYINFHCPTRDWAMWVSEPVNGASEQSKQSGAECYRASERSEQRERTNIASDRVTMCRTNDLFFSPIFISQWYTDYFLLAAHLLKIWPKHHSIGVAQSPSATQKPPNWWNTFWSRLAKIIIQTIIWGLYLIRCNSLSPL